LKEVVDTLKEAEIFGLQKALDYGYIKNIDVDKNIENIENIEVREFVKNYLVSALDKLGKKAKNR